MAGIIKNIGEKLNMGGPKDEHKPTGVPKHDEPYKLHGEEHKLQGGEQRQQGGEHKEGFVEKVKDKIHGGGEPKEGEKKKKEKKKKKDGHDHDSSSSDSD